MSIRRCHRHPVDRRCHGIYFFCHQPPRRRVGRIGTVVRAGGIVRYPYVADVNTAVCMVARR